MQTRDTITFSRDIPVRHEADVLVAGGGPAGAAAALTAARQGRSTLLLEAHTCLGGMGAAGMVPAFMQFSDGVNFLAGGVGREILDALRAERGTFPPDGFGIKAEVLKLVYDRLLTDAGVKFIFHSQVVDAVANQGRVSEVVCAGKSGLFAARARVFIDATGDGDLSAFAGAPYEKGDESGRTMPGTLCSLWSRIDWAKVNSSGLGAGGARIREAFQAGILSLEDYHLPGMWTVGPESGGGNIGHTFGVDGTDEESLTAAYLWGRKSMREYERYYKEYLKGFENMELMATGSLLGVRETRRVMGDYVLNIEDFRTRAVFPDEIGRYSYPVDIHVAGPGREHFEKFHKEHTSMRLGKGESYGIPYRILTPKGLRNVLAAGRCVSADRCVQSSIRVMPGCYITGQAAGMAAAMAAEKDLEPRDIDVKELQTRLKKIGAFLPNC